MDLATLGRLKELALDTTFLTGRPWTPLNWVNRVFGILDQSLSCNASVGEYMAASSPENILILIDELERLSKDNNKQVHMLSAFAEENMKLRKQNALYEKTLSRNLSYKCDKAGHLKIDSCRKCDAKSILYPKV